MPTCTTSSGQSTEQRTPAHRTSNARSQALQQNEMCLPPHAGRPKASGMDFPQRIATNHSLRMLVGEREPAISVEWAGSNSQLLPPHIPEGRRSQVA